MLFRYPGGKSWLAKSLLERIPTDSHLNEIMCGAADIGWKHVLRGEGTLSLNDLDKSIYEVWNSVVTCPDDLCNEIDNIEISIELFYHLKSELMSYKGVELAARKIAIHQISYSGLGQRAGGPIGGKKQLGKWKVDCAWNPEGLQKKIQHLAEFSDRVTVTNLSYDQLVLDSGIVYADPPYLIQGSNLYTFGEFPHEEFRNWITKLKLPWIVSYDNHPEIVMLFEGYHQEPTSKMVSKIGKSSSTERNRLTELLIFGN